MAMKRLAVAIVLAILIGTPLGGWWRGTVRVLHAQGTTPASSSSQQPTRVQSGLQVLYDFGSSKGAVVQDRSARGEPLDLRIADPDAVEWSDEGLRVVGKTLIRSEKPATRLIESIRRSGSITLEAWIRPARLDQEGPARIVTLSRDSGQRNFTLGQESHRFDVRLRTTGTSDNGIPAVASKEKSLAAELTHVVYTRDRGGRARIYINGELNVEQEVEGETSNWDKEFHLALANELSGDRPWLGTYRFVAIYSRDLTSREVERNFQAGSSASVDSEWLAARRASERFETRIAPLLSRHCLECHDTANRKGGLDLSRKAAAMTGGENGAAIVPGKPEESLLLLLVDLDDMPHDRPPLSSAEKSLLREWIASGATYSLDRIDPAVYAHGGGSQRIFVQRLTVPEYIETVRATVGVDIADEARELLPRDVRADGFRNTAYNLNVDLGHVEAYARLAETIVERMDVEALARKYTNSRELTDENVTKVVEPVGRLLLRGPLSEEEIETYCGVSTSVAGAGGDFEEAIGYVLQAMLQSPRFIYRIEHQRGDGSAWPAGDYELASRLSYILWGGPPDEELLEAAEDGGLDRAGIEAQARRMLKDRRAIARSRQFISQWLNLSRLDNLRPSPERFPKWNPRLADDMRRETLAFFEEVVWEQQRPLADLLNAQVTFVTPRLAKHYGLPPVDDAAEDNELIKYELASVPERGGLLTHGSVLTVGGDEASTVTRGLFVMHELLRGVVRDPPPSVDTTPVPAEPGLSRREIAETRLANASCVGCHKKFEPLSFGLVKFDGLGSYHEIDEHGNELRDDGKILFPGQAESVTYESPAELMDLLAESPRVRESLTWKVTQFALGRPLGAEDAPIIAEIHDQGQDGGGTYQSLMIAIVTSDLVRMTRTEAIASRSEDDTGP